MNLRVARDIAASPTAGLDCGKQQPGEIGANLLFGKERHVGHRWILSCVGDRLDG